MQNRGMTLKSTQIVDFCCKSSGFADFEKQWIMVQLWILVQILDCACLDVRILHPKWNLDHRSFFSLGQYVIEFIQIISLFDWSSFELRCAAFFTICAKLTYWMALTLMSFTSLPLNFYTSDSGCNCGFGFDQKYWQIEKKHESVDLCTPIHHPHISIQQLETVWGSPVRWEILWTSLYNFFSSLKLSQVFDGKPTQGSLFVSAKWVHESRDLGQTRKWLCFQHLVFVYND